MYPEQQQRMHESIGEERFREFMEKQKDEKKDEQKDGESTEDESFSDDELQLIERILREEGLTPDDGPQKKKGGFGGKGFGGEAGDYRNVSPGKKYNALVKDHNRYGAEDGKEDEAMQLTKDGNEDYTFTGGFGIGDFQKKKKDKGDKDDKGDKGKDDKGKDDKELLNYGGKDTETT